MGMESTVVKTYSLGPSFFSSWAYTPAQANASDAIMNILFILINDDFAVSDAKFILFAPFIKAYRPKNAIFAAYLSNGTDAVLLIL